MRPDFAVCHHAGGALRTALTSMYRVFFRGWWVPRTPTLPPDRYCFGFARLHRLIVDILFVCAPTVATLCVSDPIRVASHCCVHAHTCCAVTCTRCSRTRTHSRTRSPHTLTLTHTHARTRTHGHAHTPTPTHTRPHTLYILCAVLRRLRRSSCSASGNVTDRQPIIRQRRPRSPLTISRSVANDALASLPPMSL